MTLIYVILAVVGGVVFAIQGPVNTALGKRTNTMQATAVSFTGGAIVSGIIMLILHQGNLLAITKAPVWTLVGGFYGAICVLVTIASMPVLGAALSVAAIMFGSLVMGTVIDAFGWLGAEAIEVGVVRVIGLFVVAVGIFLIYLGSREKTDKNKRDLKKIAMVFIAFLSGMLGAIQNPTNASLAAVVGDWEGTFISFVVGAVVMIIVAFAFAKGKIQSFKNRGINFWMVTGGLWGVGGIFLSLFTVLKLGAALQVTCCMFGEVAGGLIIDSFGILQTAKVKTNAYRILGVATIFLGQILITLARI